MNKSCRRNWINLCHGNAVSDIETASEHSPYPPPSCQSLSNLTLYGIRHQAATRNKQAWVQYLWPDIRFDERFSCRLFSYDIGVSWTAILRHFERVNVFMHDNYHQMKRCGVHSWKWVLKTSFWRSSLKMSQLQHVLLESKVSQVKWHHQPPSEDRHI